MSSHARPSARRRVISETMPEASVSALRKRTISTGSPTGLRVNRVLPRRAGSCAMTVLAAPRMWPVDRKFSSRRNTRSLGKIACERADVPDISAAPAIDARVVVADHEDLIVLGGEQPQPGELGKVDVLELVSEHAVEP